MKLCKWKGNLEGGRMGSVGKVGLMGEKGDA